jgi:glucokinase
LIEAMIVSACFEDVRDLLWLRRRSGGGAKMKAIAIDIGGSHAVCAVVDGRTILAAERVSVGDASCFARLLPELAAVVAAVLQRCDLTAGDCGGVAVSFPGIVDPFSGRIFSTPKGKYDDSHAVHLPQWSQQCFGLPLRIENDARMALLGEQYCGALQGCDDAVMLTLGTGVGGAVLSGGRLLRGKHLQAGLGGHLPVLFDGRACICGSRGCVEAEASTWALPEICRSWPGFAESALAGEPVLDFATLFRWSRAGDAAAMAIRNRCLTVWAAGAVGLIHAFDPEAIVLGGAVMKSADQILPFLEDYIHTHAWTPWGKVRIREAELGPDAGLLGAVPLLGEPC